MIRIYVHWLPWWHHWFGWNEWEDRNYWRGTWSVVRSEPGVHHWPISKPK